MKTAPARVAFVLALLGPTGALSGCVDILDASGSAPSIAVYDIAADGTWIGRATWRSDASLARVLDATLRPREVMPVSLALTFAPAVDAPDVAATFFLDARTGEDVLITSSCAAASGCGTTTLEWGNGSASLAWYGALLIPHLVPVGRDAFRLEAGPVERAFDATRTPDGVVLSPRATSDGRRAVGGLCNILDDDTLVDLDTRVIRECRARDAPGVVHRLASGTPARGIPTDPTKWGEGRDAFESAKPRVGVLPPGADATVKDHGFSISETHRAALARSPSLTALLRAHPEAAIESAASTKRIDARVLEVVTEIWERVELAYVASGGAGHFVAVTRTIQFASGEEVSRDYVLEADEARAPEPAHAWSSMRPLPRNLTALDAALRGIAGQSVAWDVESVTLRNDAEHADGGAVYRYFIGLASAGCGDGGTCTDHIVVDAATGRVAAARLSGERLRVVLEA